MFSAIHDVERSGYSHVIVASEIRLPGSVDYAVVRSEK